MHRQLTNRDRRQADAEPTRAQLRAIEVEWPVIAGELAVVDAEIAAALVEDGVSELGRRRMRRAVEGRRLAGADVHADAASDFFGGAA